MCRPSRQARADVNRAPARLRYARRRLGLLRAALRAMVGESLPGEAAHLFGVVYGLGGESSEWRQHPMRCPNLAELLGLVFAAQAEAGPLMREHDAGHRERGDVWCSNQWTVGGRRFYSWMRSPPPGPP